MHGKKNLTLGAALAFGLFAILPVSAQMAVVEVNSFDNLLETIHNGYATYQSLQTAIQNLEYAYQTTQAQLQQLQQMDISNIHSFTDAVTLVNKEVDFARRTENRFRSISVTVGDKQVPLNEFYRIPGEANDMIVHDLTYDMSDWERARAWSYYGLDPANYMYLKAWQGRINDAGKEMQVIQDLITENNNNDNKEIAEINKQLVDPKSDLQVLQAQTALLQILIGDQKEANRLNAMIAKQHENERIAAELPVPPKSQWSADWIEK